MRRLEDYTEWVLPDLLSNGECYYSRLFHCITTIWWWLYEKMLSTNLIWWYNKLREKQIRRLAQTT